MVVHHIFVGMDVDIGENQPGDNADDQRYGELLQEADVVGSEQCTTLSDQILDGRVRGVSTPI